MNADARDDHGYAEPGKIERVTVGPEDHGIPTAQIYICGPTKNWGQALEPLAHENIVEAHAFVRSLATVFDCSPDALVGQECIALRSFGGSGSIDGLRSVKTGRTFSIQAWRTKRWPQLDPAQFDPLVANYASLWREHARLIARARDIVESISKVEGRYRKIEGEAP